MAAMDLEHASTQSAENARLFTDLYQRLRDIAERELRRNAGLPVSATTLLHEAYLGMADGKAVFPDEARFIGYAARVMRGMIIDLVRARCALKRGAGFHITRMPTEFDGHEIEEQSLSRLSQALDLLAQHDRELAELVDLRYFCGYTFDEIAAQRGISKRTAQRDWEKARLLLFNELHDSSG